MTRQVMIHNKLYEFEDFCGQVVEASRQRETLVSGHGGGGATWDGTGATAPINISSKTIVHDEFFLVNEEGKEMDFHLTDWELPVRTGHEIQMIWIYPPKSKTGWYVLMHNLNLEKVECRNAKLDELSRQHHSLIKWGGWAGVFVLAWLVNSGLICLLGLIAVYIFYRIKAKQLHDELENELRTMLKFK